MKYRTAPIPKNLRPHSWNCTSTLHPHGPACPSECKTCGGVKLPEGFIYRR